jgi:hypothetical protein
MGFRSMAHFVSGQASCVQARGIVMRTAIVAVVFWQSAAQAYASEPSFGAFPFLVHCEGRGIHRFYYLSKIGADGVAVYLSPDRQGATITVGGKAERVVAGQTGTCAGKTLEQLRSAGQTYDLPH